MQLKMEPEIVSIVDEKMDVRNIIIAKAKKKISVSAPIPNRHAIGTGTNAPRIRAIPLPATFAIIFCKNGFFTSECIFFSNYSLETSITIACPEIV